MIVSQIMTKDVVTLSARMPVKEAMEILFRRKISGLPVVNEQGRLVGMFTEKDIIKAILPCYVEDVGRFVYENTPKTVRAKIDRLKDLAVGDLMRKEVVTVEPETSVYEVVRLMMTRSVRRIVVVDASCSIVGIVSRGDVLEGILKG